MMKESLIQRINKFLSECEQNRLPEDVVSRIVDMCQDGNKFDAGKKEQLNIIIEIICQHYNVQVDTFHSENRMKELVLCRRMYYWMCKRMKIAPMNKCSKHIGYNHTTALWHNKKTEGEIQMYPSFKEEVIWIEKKVIYSLNERL